jgi:orotidine-5'-phosphate decarboxylase
MPLTAPSSPPPSASSAARDRLIVALDFPTAAAALAHVDRLDGQALWFKVGLELYLAAGAEILATLRDRGFHVFLDLKLHDIPNTVAAAIRSVSHLGASLLTVHAAGGPAMLTAAAEAATAPGAPRLLAVTVLTSMDAPELNAIGVPGAPAAQVLRLARLAQSCGIPGLVCSPQEVLALRAELGPTPTLVVPGIRPAGAAHGDQRRIATPAAALADGASMLVVGRPITQSPHPAAALAAILAAILEEMNR